MNQQTSTAAGARLEGSMYLYSQPEVLTLEDHGSLGINSARRYDFVKSARVVPIAMVEFAFAQRDYPIVFSDLKEPDVMIVVAMLDDVNLFVDENGEWDSSTYIPAYVRSHPFALTARPDDHFAIVIDRAASVISEDAEQPFFEGRNLSQPIQARVDFSAKFRAHREETKAFCDKLVELGVLANQEARVTPADGGEERSIGPYVAVDFDKVNELDAQTLKQLHLDGTLSAIYAHRFSLENWFRLLERRSLRRSNG